MRMSGCKKNVQYISQIHFEDKLYEHIHRDKISLMIVDDTSRRTQINEDDSYEHVPFELAGCYGYD